MQDFIIYGIRERHSEQILYVGYARSGKTSGMTAARNLYPDEMDLIGVNLQELETDKYDEAIYLANLYRIKFGLKASTNRMKFGNTIDPDGVWFEFELPVMSEKDKRKHDLKRASKLRENRPVRSLIGKVEPIVYTSTRSKDKPKLASNVVRIGARFKEKHDHDDVNGFVRYVPSFNGIRTTWKVELVKALIYG